MAGNIVSGCLILNTIVFGADETKPTISVRAGQIMVIGNKVAPDWVIRSQLRIYPGMVVSREDLKRAAARLRRLGLFKVDATKATDVLVQALKGFEKSEYVDILVTVRELPRTSVLFENGTAGALVWEKVKWDIVKFGPPMMRLGATALEKQWANLTDSDHGKVLRAIAVLAETPNTAIPFIEERIQPVRRAKPRLVVKWINDLGSKRFAVRQSAMHELVQCDMQAEPYLVRASMERHTLEVYRRLKLTLRRIQETPSAEIIRSLRAVYALECMQTNAARRVLRALASGGNAARVTQAAQAALHRNAMSPSKKKESRQDSFFSIPTKSR